MMWIEPIILVEHCCSERWEMEMWMCAICCFRLVVRSLREISMVEMPCIMRQKEDN